MSGYPMVFFLLFFALIISCKQADPKQGATHEGMRWIPGGTFIMGTDESSAYSHERPAHTVRVDGFWMDETEVTNSQFQKFIETTGYITVAERKPEWDELKKQLPAGTPKPHDSLLVAGSLVFTPPSKPVNLADYSQWWHWVTDANWAQPEGKGSTVEKRWDHPVVHIAYEDAKAYCSWSGKRCPLKPNGSLLHGAEQNLQPLIFQDLLRLMESLLRTCFKEAFRFTTLPKMDLFLLRPLRAFLRMLMASTI